MTVLHGVSCLVKLKDFLVVMPLIIRLIALNKLTCTSGPYTYFAFAIVSAFHVMLIFCIVHHM